MPGDPVLVIEPRTLDHPDAAALVDTIQRYYEQLYGGFDEDSLEVDEFAPPGGLFLVGYLDGMPVACGGWRVRPDDAVEIKRMYVAAHLRNLGLARQMLAALERTAAEAGARRVLLNTGFRQRTAMRFYQRNGYTRTSERYGHYEHIDGAFFFVKPLAD